MICLLSNCLSLRGVCELLGSDTALLIFLVAMTKYGKRSSFRKQGFILAYNSRVESIMVGGGTVIEAKHEMAGV